MNKAKQITTFLLLLITFVQASAQSYDDTFAGINDCTEDNSTTIGIIQSVDKIKPLTFTFNNMTDYYGGITISGAHKIQVIVTDNAAEVTNNCYWGLKMIITGFAAVPPAWDKTATYGSGLSGSTPEYFDIDVRVTNPCRTPTAALDAGWVNFAWSAPRAEYVIDIIDDNFPISNDPDATCGNPDNSEVNRPGSYLTNYDQYTFDVDFRIKPGFVFAPGIYQVSVKYQLYEH